MKQLYLFIETKFEKITSVTMSVIGNSITFMVAIMIVIFWLTGKQFASQNLHQKIENIIVAVTFLILFIIQREFKRFSASLHIKLNELISTSEAASNKLMNVEEQTESELMELTKMYSETAAAEKLIDEETI
jgi:low affinity Fe/Cu permease